ncbi:bifunctional (p)ppGpp synthetase/guanosine-3',5'-bis(diphosphate) 3'-pyrophosphohydrolase [Halobacillus fulvus]|nr:bifunctional (p)ppGpp synthetase/guanosine-3',5'-bis(diphosphate) 3'-pyrophosphohydrolase [Halobacillus fulvus]
MLMIEKAKSFATKAHAGQKRKKSDADYIVHPIRVAERLERAGYGEAVICAGYLHDVVEDTSYNIEDIRREFGEDVARIVQAHTEDKTKSWKERKQHTIDVVRNGSKEVKALIVADKLDNLESLQADLAEEGKAVWNGFNAGYEKQKWYNESVVESMKHGLTEKEVPGFFYVYRDLVQKTFSH